MLQMFFFARIYMVNQLIYHKYNPALTLNI